MVQKFLQCSDIPFPTRRPVFLNLVYNTFLSGMEPEQVHFNELKSCDQEMVKYLKKKLGTNASITLSTFGSVLRTSRMRLLLMSGTTRRLPLLDPLLKTPIYFFPSSHKSGVLRNVLTSRDRWQTD